MFKTFLAAACGVVLLAGTASATTYAWSLSGGANNDTGSGFLDTGAASFTGLEVVDFTGTLSADNGLITGAVMMIGGDPGYAAALSLPLKVAYDNVVFPDQPNQLVDGNGILMSVGSGTVVAEIDQRGPGIYDLYVGDSSGVGTTLYSAVSLTFTLTEVPEPTSAALLAAGLAGIVASRRRAVDRVRRPLGR